MIPLEELLPKPPSHKKTIEITQSELTALRQLILQFPHKSVFKPGTDTGIGLNHTVYKFGHKYVFEGAEIGRGNRGVVYLSMMYEKLNATENGNYCVIKKPLNDNMRDTVINFFLSITDKMKTEALLHNQIYQFGDWMMDDNNSIVIVLPFLGEISLDSLLKDIPQLQAISTEQWLSFYILLTHELNGIHKDNKIIHGDITTRNICITLQNNRFISLHLVDMGTAHQFNSFSLPGSIETASPESFLLFPLFNYETTDIYSLGVTYMKILNTLMTYKCNNYCFETFNNCKSLFMEMQASLPSNRSTLKKVMHRLISIKTEFDILHLAFEMSTLNHSLVPRDDDQLNISQPPDITHPVAPPRPEVTWVNHKEASRIQDNSNLNVGLPSSLFPIKVFGNMLLRSSETITDELAQQARSTLSMSSF